MRNSLFVVVVLFLISVGCKQEEERTDLFGFSEAQPSGVKNLKKIPDRLLGKYLNPADSTVLKIGPKIIEKTVAFSGMIHVNELDSVGSYNGYFIFVKKTNEKIPAEKLATAFGFICMTPTLFSV